MTDSPTATNSFEGQSATATNTSKGESAPNQEMLEQLASVGAMMGSVIHDLRNPINVIKTSQYFLQTKLAGEDPRLLRHLELINKACNTAVAVLEDLGEYGKGHRLRPELHPVMPIVRIAIDRCRQDATRLQVESDEDLPPVFGDTEYLTLALRKLLDWALERSPAGSPVHLGIHRSGSGIEITVEDKGPAIHEQQRETLFEPLITEAGARSTNLPAAIIAEVMHRSGGRARAVDTGNEGSRVVVNLPCSVPPSEGQ